VDFTFNSFIFNGFILYNRWPDATLEANNFINDNGEADNT
jgi:hypothetical protein